MDTDASVTPSMSGRVIRKGFLVRNRYAELRDAVLTFYKDSKKKSIDSQITITPNTKIKEEPRGNKTRITILDETHEEFFDLKDKEQVFNWLVALKACLYVNPDLSMSMFDIISVIGRGSNGKVMLVQKKDTKQYFAVKTIRKNQLSTTKKLNMVVREKSILVKSKHPFIIELKFAFQTLSKFYLGMEFVPGGDLYFHMDRRGCFNVAEVRMIIAEIALAFDYLHQNKILYRDLKPENVLLDKNGYVKITDFGLAKEHKDPEAPSTICGTVDYMAPEVVAQKPYSFPADWWTLGILAYEISFGHAPFSGENMQQVFNDITTSDPHFSKKADPNLREVIMALLRKDPAQRAKLSDLKGMKLFEGIDWEELLGRKIPAPFVPEIVDGKANNFDRNFTRERAWDSISSPVMEDDAHCTNFSYTNIESSILVQPSDLPLGSNGKSEENPS